MDPCKLTVLYVEDDVEHGEQFIQAVATALRKWPLVEAGFLELDRLPAGVLVWDEPRGSCFTSYNSFATEFEALVDEPAAVQQNRVVVVLTDMRLEDDLRGGDSVIRLVEQANQARTGTLPGIPWAVISGTEEAPPGPAGMLYFAKEGSWVSSESITKTAANVAESFLKKEVLNRLPYLVVPPGGDFPKSLVLPLEGQPGARETLRTLNARAESPPWPFLVLEERGGIGEEWARVYHWLRWAKYGGPVPGRHDYDATQSFVPFDLHVPGYEVGLGQQCRALKDQLAQIPEEPPAQDSRSAPKLSFVLVPPDQPSSFDAVRALAALIETLAEYPDSPLFPPFPSIFLSMSPQTEKDALPQGYQRKLPESLKALWESQCGGGGGTNLPGYPRGDLTLELPNCLGGDADSAGKFVRALVVGNLQSALESHVAADLDVVSLEELGFSNLAGAFASFSDLRTELAGVVEILRERTPEEGSLAVRVEDFPTLTRWQQHLPGLRNAYQKAKARLDEEVTVNCFGKRSTVPCLKCVYDVYWPRLGKLKGLAEKSLAATQGYLECLRERAPEKGAPDRVVLAGDLELELAPLQQMIRVFAIVLSDSTLEGICRSGQALPRPYVADWMKMVDKARWPELFYPWDFCLGRVLDICMVRTALVDSTSSTLSRRKR